MNKLKSFLRHFLTGVGFGSFFLSAIKLSFSQTLQISRPEFFWVLIASGLIGLYAYIFSFDYRHFATVFIVHFLLTLSTVMITAAALYQLTDFASFAYLFLIFLIVYGLVWLVNSLYTKNEVNEVNNKLLQKKLPKI